MNKTSTDKARSCRPIDVLLNHAMSNESERQLRDDQLNSIIDLNKEKKDFEEYKKSETEKLNNLSKRLNEKQKHNEKQQEKIDADKKMLTKQSQQIIQDRAKNDQKTKELRESEKLLKQKHDSLDSNNAYLQEKIELINKLEKSLNSTREDLNSTREELNKREKHIEAREAYGKQNLASKSDITNNFTETENKLTETLFMVSDEIIKAINVPQKKKPSKEKVNDDQVDFLKHKQSISLSEDYVFSLQNGEELGKCENLQDFISGIGRAKITGNIDDFLADFNFYFHDEGEPFFEVNIAELHENTQKDLIETFLKNA